MSEILVNTIKKADGTGSLTVPAETGTVLTSASDITPNNNVAFSAYKNPVQYLTSGTVTKITYEEEDFDTDNCFASSAFTPTTAGYYQLNVNLYAFANSSITSLDIRLYKNGSIYLLLQQIRSPSGIAGDLTGSGSALVYSNGTDYWEIYARVTGTTTIQASANRTYNSFNGFLVRTV